MSESPLSSEASAGHRGSASACCARVSVIAIGVIPTVLRALGIPNRPVTGLSVGQRPVVDLHVEAASGRLCAELNEPGSGIRRNHIWTEFWTQRGDMPAGNGGWQAIDVLRRGGDGFDYALTPVTAVKADTPHLGRDARTIAAAVNCRTNVWLVDVKENVRLYKTLPYVLVQPFVNHAAATRAAS